MRLHAVKHKMRSNIYYYVVPIYDAYANLTPKHFLADVCSSLTI